MFLNNNGMTVLPPELCTGLTSLYMLDLRANRLAVLSVDMNWPCLERLYLQDNHLMNLTSGTRYRGLCMKSLFAKFCLSASQESGI